MSSLPPGLTGILFPTQGECAYSAQRIWLAVGFTLGFIIAEVLDLHSRVWFMLIAVVLVLCCNLTIEVVTRRKVLCVDSYSNKVSAEHITTAAVSSIRTAV